ncbi:hypothetical protein L7F22_020448 [Adiantum nelumboides]|nr:hypothetical protein [Adiantum nelumboides]
MDKMELADRKALDKEGFGLRQIIATAACDAAGKETRLAQMIEERSRPLSGVRIVQIFSPLIVQTDPANFRSLVQQLTGKDSTDYLNEKRCEAARQASNLAEAEAAAPPLSTARPSQPTQSIDCKLSALSRASRHSQRGFSQYPPSGHIKKRPAAPFNKRSHEAGAKVSAQAAALISPQALWDQSFFSDLGSVPSSGPPSLHLFDEPLYPSWAIVGDIETV